MKIFKKNWIWVFLICLFIVGLALRLYGIENNLFFGPEQGRDLLAVQNIVDHHKLTLLGPRTDINGIFYGPAFYYFMTIPYLITGGSPVLMSVFLIIISALGIFVIYLLATELFNTRVGIISSSIYAFSLWIVISSRWLSHPPLAIVLSILFAYGLVKFVKGSPKYIIFSAVAFGLCGQTQMFSFPILGLFFVFFLFLFRKSLAKNRSYLLAAIILMLGISIGNVILFDLKHNFLITNGLKTLLLGKADSEHFTYLSVFQDYVSNFISVSSQVIFPNSQIVAPLIIIAGLVLLFLKRNKTGLILPLWLLASLITFVIFKHDILDHYFMSFIPPMIIITAFLIDELWKKKVLIGAFLLAVILIANLYGWYQTIPPNKMIFFQQAQSGLKFEDEKAVVERIYKESANRNFYYQAYTIPYWLPQGWDYLFWYFGKNGSNQKTNQNAKLLFVIIQDDSNKLFQDNWKRDIVAHWGKELKRFRYGIIEVRKIETLHEG